jgi:inorganic pyrophosphatase/exopolyphosphatase
MSQKLVLGAMAVGTTSTVVAQIRKNERGKIPRTVLAGFVVAIALLFLSESQTDLADSIAVLIMVAALIGPNGTEILGLINKLVNS